MTKTVRLKRLFGKLASVRDYIVHEVVQGNGSLIIKVEGIGEYMELSAADLESKRFQISTKKIESKYNPGQFYELIDFAWNPNKNL